MTGSYPLDLVLLVADLDQQETVRTLLSHRGESLGIRPIRPEILKHPRHDPGCFNEAPDVLQPYQARARHGLVLLDREGSGREAMSAEEMEADLNGRLSASGWGERARAVVIDPELEIWVWSDSPKVDAALGWSGRAPGLRDWLRNRGSWPAGAAKPLDPKEALGAALKEVRRRTGAAIFSALAQGVGLERCQDLSFGRLRTQLRTWFAS